MALRPSTKFAFALAALGALTACADLTTSRQAVTVLPPPPAPPSLSQAPAPPPQMAPMQAPAPATAPTPRTGNGALAGHLASYRTAESAQAGWQQLVRAQPALQTLKPYFVAATINGQPWVRVLAGDFPNAEEVNRFCNWARAQRLYCAPMTINSAGQAMPAATAAPRPQRQPRGTPQPAAPAAPAGQSMMTPAQPEAPPPVAAAPAAVAPPPPAPAQQVSNPAAQPPQPLAPPLPPRRQPSQPAVPQ
jgi:hypothetical protein